MMVTVGSHSCRKLPAIKWEKCPTIMQTTIVGTYSFWSVQTLAMAFMTFAITSGYRSKALKKLWAFNQDNKVDPKNSTCTLAKTIVNPWRRRSNGFPVNGVRVAAVHLSAKRRMGALLGHPGHQSAALLALCMSEKCRKQNTMLLVQIASSNTKSKRQACFSSRSDEGPGNMWANEARVLLQRGYWGERDWFTSGEHWLTVRRRRRLAPLASHHAHSCSVCSHRAQRRGKEREWGGCKKREWSKLLSLPLLLLVPQFELLWLISVAFHSVRFLNGPPARPDLCEENPFLCQTRTLALLEILSKHGWKARPATPVTPCRPCTCAALGCHGYDRDGWLLLALSADTVRV